MTGRAIDRLSLAALAFVQDDYESVATVVGDVSEAMKQRVSEQDLLAALRELEFAGLVCAYRTSPDSLEMIQTRSLDSDTSDSVWFLATPDGRSLVQAQWSRVFPSEEGAG